MNLESDTIALAACDSEYFIRYAPALVESCIEVRLPIIVDVINHSSQSMQLAEAMKPLSRVGVETRYIWADLHKVGAERRRTFYASQRFASAQELIEVRRHPVLTVDVDSLMLGWPMPIPQDTTVGIWLRENDHLGANPRERRGMQCLAGLCYFSPDALPFLRDMNRYIKSSEEAWFVDQEALHQTYLKHCHSNSMRFCDLSLIEDGALMDWEFGHRSYSWTGKGDRKHSDFKYTRAVTTYTERFYDRIGMKECRDLIMPGC